MMLIAAIPTGMLMANTQGQPTVLVIRPPRAGPMIAATPQTADSTPCIRARRAGEKMSPAIVIEIGSTAPAPRPWIVLNTISSSMEPDSPHSADPVTNRASPNMNTGLRP